MCALCITQGREPLAHVPRILPAGETFVLSACHTAHVLRVVFCFGFLDILG